MKAMPDLDALLARAKTGGVFGTKMRSVINRPTPKLSNPSSLSSSQSPTRSLRRV
jgi:fructose-bisphosphate aldolase class 1